MAYIEGLNAIAQKEGNAKKPIYQMHKGWARRLGSVLSMLILAAFAKEDIHPTDFYRVRMPPFILNAFMGGGTTIVEAPRL